MRIVFAVCFLFIARVASYPSFHESTNDAEENNNDLQLELRSILDHLDNEQMERSVVSDEDDSDQSDDTVDKRQGGYNVIKPDLKCEIECVGKLRNPTSGGQGMTIKEAANACKNICPRSNNKRELDMSTGQRQERTHQKSLREFPESLTKQLQLTDSE